MDKRVRLLPAAGQGSLVQEMAGDKVVNQVFLMSRGEAEDLFIALQNRYGFVNQILDTFPSQLFRGGR